MGGDWIRRQRGCCDHCDLNLACWECDSGAGGVRGGDGWGGEGE